MPNRQATIHFSTQLQPLCGLAFALILGLAACSRTLAVQPVIPSPQPGTTKSPSPTIQTTSGPATSTALPVATMVPTTTPTPACMNQLGQVQEMELDTTRMYEPFKFRVYLPPCYAQETNHYYPVLYLFHGLFFSDDQWVRIGVVEVVNRLIITGGINPFIIVMPYDPNQREPGSTSFDEVFMEDLLPYIDANYRILPGSENRAMGGLSRGAGWALHFGLIHPDLFGVIGAHSPIIFWEDSAEIEKWLDSIPRTRMPRFYVDIGENDPNPESANLLEKLLTDRNISHVYHTSLGYHTEQYWGSQVESYIRWYAAGW
jgi:enterochelin esterase-like enzyme